MIDSKQYLGRLRLHRDGMVWHGRHLLVSVLRKVLWEADQADEVLGIAEIVVAGIVAVHGASVPWGRLQADGVTIVPARRVPGLLQELPAILGPSGWPGWPTEPAAVPPRRLTACTDRLSKRDCCSRGLPGRLLVRWTAFDQPRPGALLSSNDFRSSVERDGAAIRCDNRVCGAARKPSCRPRGSVTSPIGPCASRLHEPAPPREGAREHRAA